jgi:flagellar biosynthesis/type III secretory pathway protein FliH
MNTQYNYPNLKKAVELLDESNYTEDELVAYDRYLDNIRSWNSTMKSSYIKGRDEGVEVGRDEGREIGRDEGRELERQLILKIINDLREKISVDEISTKYGVKVSFVEQFVKD